MKTEPAPGTVSQALDWGVERLRTSRLVPPRQEAIRLWSDVIGADPAAVLIGGSAPIGDDQWTAFKTAIEGRVRGEPSAYTTGRAGFRTLELSVDRRVLIPRPETEGLVQLVLDWADDGHHAAAVADVGTGSGCIALSLAAEGAGRFRRIVATDDSPDALAVATENRDALDGEVASLVEFTRGDLLDALQGETFDVIVSNPPYVSSLEYSALDGSVRDFEPRAALVSAQEGMDHVTRLLEGAGAYLRTGGMLGLEIDARRANLVLETARRASWHHPRIERDLFGRDRYLVATKPAAPGSSD